MATLVEVCNMQTNKLCLTLPVLEVCDMQTNKLCLTLIDPTVYYDPVRVVKQQTGYMEIGDNFGFIAACHSDHEDDEESEYATSFDSHAQQSSDSSPANETFILPEHCYPNLAVNTTPQTVIDYHYGDTISIQDYYSIGSWANNSYHESYAVDTTLHEMRSNEYDEDYHKEKMIEFHGLVMDDEEVLHTSHAVKNETSIGRNTKPSIDVHQTVESKENVNDNIDYGSLTPDEFDIFRDLEGQARAMDGRILNISKEDIADIIDIRWILPIFSHSI